VTSSVEPVSSDAARPDRDARSRAWGDHPVNLRMTILGRYYVVQVAGKERRSEQRRIEERQKHPLDTLANALLMLIFGSMIGLALYGLQMTLCLWTLERFVVAP
jgi:hypothetical protein